MTWPIADATPEDTQIFGGCKVFPLSGQSNHLQMNNLGEPSAPPAGGIARDPHPNPISFLGVIPGGVVPIGRRPQLKIVTPPPSIPGSSAFSYGSKNPKKSFLGSGFMPLRL
jgi:hypothetical protein